MNFDFMKLLSNPELIAKAQNFLSLYELLAAKVKIQQIQSEKQTYIALLLEHNPKNILRIAAINELINKDPLLKVILPAFDAIDRFQICGDKTFYCALIFPIGA